MKVVKYTTFFVFVVFFVLCSCKKEKQKYSCDPVVDEWVKENKRSFQDITREQIGLLPMGLQKSVFLALKPEKQFQLWFEKFAIVREQWDVPVQEIIDEVFEVFDVSWYECPLTDERIEFIEKIEHEILTNLMDSIDYVINFCLLSTEDELVRLKNPEEIDYSWISFPSEIKVEDFSKEAPGGGGSSVFDCKCEWHVTCLWSQSLCIKGGCRKTVKGCGFGFSKPCTGTCSLAMK